MDRQILKGAKVTLEVRELNPSGEDFI